MKFFLAALGFLALNAQAQTTSVAGNVVDRWETAVPKTSLTLTNLQTGTTFEATANAAGKYVFAQATPGRYDLTARAEGFKLYTRHGVEIGGAATEMEIRMDREKEDAAASVAELEALAAAKPDDYTVQYNLGRVYFARGNLQKAADQFQAILRPRPDDSPANFALAQVMLRGRMPSVALNIAEKMISLNPGDGSATILAATVYRRQGNIDEAVQLLEKFLRSNPNDSDALFELGSAYLQRKQYPEAGKEFSRAYGLDPSDLRGLRGLTDIQLAMKQPDKALALDSAEVEEHPERADLRRELAATEVRVQQVDKAIADLQSILDKYQESPKEQAVTYAQLGEAHRIKEDLPRSIENLQKAAHMEPDNTAYVMSMASAYDLSGQPKEALKYYQEALKLEPGNALLLNNTAYTMVKAGGDLDEALRLVQLARRQLPEESEVLDTLGWVYLKKNMVDSAAQIFHDLVAKAGTNATYHYHYAMALAQKGDKAAALNEFGLALQNKPGKSEQEEIKEWIRKLS